MYLFSLWNEGLWVWDKVLVVLEVGKVSEKSWGTNGLMPPPPTKGCLNPGVFWEVKPHCCLKKAKTQFSKRQFFQAWSHQFLCEGSPSNVLPFCCAVTCVIPQFIALWAGSFYHERFLFVSFTLLLLFPCSHPLPRSSLICSVCCCRSLMARSQHWQCDAPSPPWLHNVLKPISVNFLNFEFIIHL